MMTGVLTFAASHALAQTLPAAPPPKATAPATTPSASGPVVNTWYIGGFSGLAMVKNSAPQAGVEVGVRAAHNLDIFVEAGWMSDVVTKATLDHTTVVTTYLQTTQGKTATGTVKAPATFGSAGARWVFESSSMIRPYVVGTVGLAAVEFNPAFTLAGSDITASRATYGVTLGTDINGKQTKATFGGGAGVLFVLGTKLDVDAGYRLTSISTTGNRTNVSRLNIGFGYRF
jgi:opacity protein-like surface antigen